MSDREQELLRFYTRHRIEDQHDFYRDRGSTFDRASGQLAAVSAGLGAAGTVATVLSVLELTPASLWTVLATVLPAGVTAAAAYGTLLAFDQQSKIYADAVAAIDAARAPSPHAGTPVAEVVGRVAAALRAEQAQWGQLTTDIPTAEGPTE